jgi:hypothetical protein
MSQSPAPVTAPPSPDGPYDSGAAGTGDSQSDSGHVYDAAGGAGTSEPWVKVQKGGACDMSGRITGEWPGDGTSDGSAWSQA